MDGIDLESRVVELEQVCRGLERRVAFLTAKLHLASRAAAEPLLLAALLDAALPDELLVHGRE